MMIHKHCTVNTTVINYNKFLAMRARNFPFSATVFRNVPKSTICPSNVNRDLLQQISAPKAKKVTNSLTEEEYQHQYIFKCIKLFASSNSS
jgi:hypothetical protein